MRSKLVVPRNQAREMVPGPDLDRMLNSGSYLVASIPKQPTRHSIAQRDYKRRRLEAGYRNLDILLPEHVYRFLQSRLRDGESMAELIERLLFSTGDNNQYCCGVEDK